MPIPLSIGDVVKLESGGPAMTVTNVRSTGDVDYQWFDKDGARGGGLYPPAALEAVLDSKQTG